MKQTEEDMTDCLFIFYRYIWNVKGQELIHLTEA